LTEATLRGGMLDARVDTESVGGGRDRPALGKCSVSTGLSHKSIVTLVPKPATSTNAF
jgi:hypothetical protein